MKPRQIAIALDQLGNALLGGWADETISARAYRQSGHKRRWHVARVIIDVLFFWEHEHCANAYWSERERTQTAPEYRQ